MIFKRRRPSRWADVDYMTLIPERRLGSDVNPETGLVRVLVPRYRDVVLGRWLQPRLKPHKKHIRVPLEARGTFLWNQVDGRRSVAELSVLFAAHFTDDAEKAPIRVAQYLHAMYDNGFIKYINEPEAAS